MKQVSHTPHTRIPYNGVFSLSMTSAMMEIECSYSTPLPATGEPQDPMRLVEVLTELGLRAQCCSLLGQGAFLSVPPFKAT